jgi:DNA invertase Pin-like site-specific DNA recombinase
MKSSGLKPQRCAIYTRKSTEHNLDMAFNSLDAQREACEAYIKSQAHEGWKLIPAHFDDGGLSGASLNRPALQALLDEVRAAKIDIVVVYKVDRLTRSLADFAKLVELFDEHDVSFVSVTQSFNTTSSMGRLTLNVLLSFAQFEREVIGERVRDKIAASKRKGIWVGGPIPLGYRSVAKKLEIVPDEANLVRKIFADYMRLGSIGALAASLNGEGLRPKPRPLANGRTLAADCYRVGPLAHLLKNRFYVGEIAYRDEVHQGEHEPILDRALFEAVQARLSENAVEHKTMRSRSPSILRGKIFDDRGNPMSPSHANKKGVRYRYYVSHALLQGRKDETGSVSRIAAPDVEAIVCSAVREHLSTTDAIDHTIDRELIEAHVKRIVISGSSIQIALRATASNSDDLESHIAHDDANCLTIPFRPFALPKKGIAHAPNGPARLDPKTRDTLLQAIVRARGWMEALLNGKASSFDEIAVAEGLVERHVRRLVPLAFLSPKVIKAIADGAAPDGMTISTLTQALPHSWSAQERMLGLE